MKKIVLGVKQDKCINLTLTNTNPNSRAAGRRQQATSMNYLPLVINELVIKE